MTAECGPGSTALRCSVLGDIDKDRSFIVYEFARAHGSRVRDRETFAGEDDDHDSGRAAFSDRDRT